MTAAARYQDSSNASKHNAFCWKTWTPQFDHQSLPVASPVRDAEPADVKPRGTKGTSRPRSSSIAGRMRARLQQGPATPAELAKLADIKYPAHVRTYLKRDLNAERVRFEAGVYRLAGVAR